MMYNVNTVLFGLWILLFSYLNIRNCFQCHIVNKQVDRQGRQANYHTISDVDQAQKHLGGGEIPASNDAALANA